jgi:hypothetical protein
VISDRTKYWLRNASKRALHSSSSPRFMAEPFFVFVCTQTYRGEMLAGAFPPNED